VAAEALRNAVRHAGARHCLVRLTHEPDGAVSLVVRDDGRGFDPDAPPGIGLVSMQERAAELDGTVDVASDESGTRVEMWLP
jgi:signal transduction histidine kinase